MIVATCGKSEIDEFKSLKAFRKNSKDDAGYDLAILETKSLIKEINPIPITKYPQMYFERPMCRVMGYGYDEQKRTDDLRGFDLNTERLFYSKDVQKYIRMSSKLGPVLLNTVTEGDSGGPLLCRMTENSPWEILGVSSNYHRDRPTKSIIDNYFMPAFILNSNL